MLQPYWRDFLSTMVTPGGLDASMVQEYLCMRIELSKAITTEPWM